MKIKVSNTIIENFLNGKQTHLILEDDSLNNKDHITLYEDNNEIDAEITAKSKFNNIEECLKIIPYDLFGSSNQEELITEYKNKNNIVAYRLKVDTDNKTYEAVTKINGEKESSSGGCYLTSACMKYFQEKLEVK